MKTINMTHRAQFHQLGGKRSIKDRILSVFLPQRDIVGDYLGAMGGLLAATYAYKGGYVSGVNTGMPAAGYSVSVADIRLDFAAIALARTAAGQTALAAADILQLIELPAGVYVPLGVLQCITAEGETATADLGDGSSVAGYLDDFNCNTAGWGFSGVTTAYSVAVGGGKLYTASDTIDLLLNTAAFNVAVVGVRAICIDCRGTRQ